MQLDEKEEVRAKVQNHQQVRAENDHLLQSLINFLELYHSFYYFFWHCICLIVYFEFGFVVYTKNMVLEVKRYKKQTDISAH